MVMVWCATARGRVRKGSVCVSSGCDMWFVSSRLVVLSLGVFCPCVATAARTTAQTRQASFAIANTRPSHRRPSDRREMTRGLGSRVNPQWHLKCPRAFERQRHDGEALRHPTHTSSTPGPAVPFAAICRRAPCVSPNVMVKLGGFQGELRARRGRRGSSF